MSADTLHELVRSSTRADFLARVLATGVVADSDPAFPTMPPEDVQEQFVGLRGEAALAQAAEFYRAIVSALERLGKPLTSESSVLDFGAGWGRILRFFAYDVADHRLVGVDVDDEVLGLARGSKVPGALLPIGAFPPIEIEPSSFDLIYAFSVFSHLNEATATEWIGEFYRLLKPGGVAVITTRAREFVELCAQLRSAAVNSHQSAISQAFADTELVLANYDLGRVVHEPITGGASRPSSFYGETAIPETFVRDVWAQWFDVVEFVRDPFPGSYQSLFVLQRV